MDIVIKSEAKISKSRQQQLIIDEIRRLSQEEGLRDIEIADIIEYNRVSVQRIRRENNIPKYNIKNRKDKEVICPQCLQHYMIRRSEKPGICCPDCLDALTKKIEEQYENKNK